MKTNIDQAIFRMAGTMILLSLLLAVSWHQAWLLLTAFVGLNMLQASFTGFCPVVKVFRKLGFEEGAAFRSACCGRDRAGSQ